MGARILRRRKEKGLTQEALANKLGVSNQAVSKWEGDVCCPDLQLLPLLADTLELSLDELFGRESMAKAAQKAEADSQILPIAAELPWEDDDAIHAVLFQGHRLLQPKQGSLFRHDKYDEIRKTVELHFSGTAQDIYSDFSVVCTDSTISGSVRAGDGVTCTDVGGDVSAGDDVTCGRRATACTAPATCRAMSARATASPAAMSAAMCPRATASAAARSRATSAQATASPAATSAAA